MSNLGPLPPIPPEKCQYDHCLDDAVMMCVGTTLAENECVTYRCQEHTCGCRDGVKTMIKVLS